MLKEKEGVVEVGDILNEDSDESEYSEQNEESVDTEEESDEEINAIEDEEFEGEHDIESLEEEEDEDNIVGSSTSTTTTTPKPTTTEQTTTTTEKSATTTVKPTTTESTTTTTTTTSTPKPTTTAERTTTTTTSTLKPTTTTERTTTTSTPKTTTSTEKPTTSTPRPTTTEPSTTTTEATTTTTTKSTSPSTTTEKTTTPPPTTTSTSTTTEPPTETTTPCPESSTTMKTTTSPTPSPVPSTTEMLTTTKATTPKPSLINRIIPVGSKDPIVFLAPSEVDDSISPDSINTAHCMYQQKRSLFSIQLLQHDRLNDDLSQIITRTISRVYIHPRYNTRSTNRDIALIKLNQPLDFSTTAVRPICLPTVGSVFGGRTGVIAGWGTVSENGNESSILKKAKIPIITNRQCRAAGVQGITSNMICAGRVVKGGVDTCQGDSGGPLMVVENKRYKLAGIVSFGEGCGRRFRPGLLQHDRLNDDLSQIINRTISRVYIHPRYNSRSTNRDIALIKLNQPLDFSTTAVRPICLPTVGSVFGGRTGVIAGWGTVSENGNESTILKKAKIPIITNRQCRSAGVQGITSNMICAGRVVKGGVDTCQGDSGGPLMVVENKRYKLAGIVSFGEGCGRKFRPGVYTRTTKFIGWITQTANTGCYCK
uniref:Peptidase S1 domain-containing protein n=1 Tax=Megaselia scalaris TaxID=36166 RepID=T1GJF3_MEGSC